jgi:hypothetical protein
MQIQPSFSQKLTVAAPSDQALHDAYLSHALDALVTESSYITHSVTSSLVLQVTDHNSAAATNMFCGNVMWSGIAGSEIACAHPQQES